MKLSFLDVLQETFLDPNFNIQALQTLMEQTTVYLRELKVKSESKDPDMREEALRESIELKSILTNKLNELCQTSGLTPQQLAEISKDPSKMTQEHWNFIRQMKSRFEEIQNPPATGQTKLKLRKPYA